MEVDIYILRLSIQGLFICTQLHLLAVKIMHKIAIIILFNKSLEMPASPIQTRTMKYS